MLSDGDGHNEPNFKSWVPSIIDRMTHVSAGLVPLSQVPALGSVISSVTLPSALPICPRVPVSHVTRLSRMVSPPWHPELSHCAMVTHSSTLTHQSPQRLCRDTTAWPRWSWAADTTARPCVTVSQPRMSASVPGLLTAECHQCRPCEWIRHMWLGTSDSKCRDETTRTPALSPGLASRLLSKRFTKMQLEQNQWCQHNLLMFN